MRNVDLEKYEDYPYNLDHPKGKMIVKKKWNDMVSGDLIVGEYPFDWMVVEVGTNFTWCEGNLAFHVINFMDPEDGGLTGICDDKEYEVDMDPERKQRIIARCIKDLNRKIKLVQTDLEFMEKLQRGELQ